MKKQYKKLIIIQILIIIFIIMSYVLIRSEKIFSLSKCIYREKFGIICPACYGTTFAIELSKFNFLKAFCIHPLFFILLIYLMLIDIVYVINVIFNKKINIFKWWYVLIWVIALVIYTVIKNLL